MQLQENQQFNSFTLLSVVPVLEGKRRLYHVKCQCGAEQYRRLNHLITGRTKSCKKCASKLTALTYGTPQRNEFIGSLGKTFFSTIKNGAVRRNIEFNVSQEFLWELLCKQGFKCALTNVDINLTTKIKASNPDYSSFTASVDRIDSSKGYTTDNVQWVHKDINRLKNNLPQNKFIELCSLVAVYANQQPSTSGMV